MLWVTAALFLIFFCSLLYAVLQLKKKGERVAQKAAAGSLALYTLVLAAALLFRLDVPYYVLWLGMAAVWLNSFAGYYLDRYNTSARFDRYLHAFGSFSFALLLYCLVRSVAQEGGDRFFRAAFVWALGGFAGGAFEVFEFMKDRREGTRAQRGLKDTDTDLAADLIGSFAAGVFAFFLLLK